MRSRFFNIPAALLAVACLTSTVSAEDNTFTEGEDNNHWNNGENWSLNHPPEADERAVIPNGENCVIHAGGNDAVAQSFSVLGTLTIQAGRKLTITANSTIGGLLTIEGAVTTIGELVIDGTLIVGADFTNDGDLILAGGKISGTSSDHLTFSFAHSDFRVRGYGRIAVPLTNNVSINANESGETLYLSDFDMDGSVDQRTQWTASTGTLQVDVQVTGSGSWGITSGVGEIILNVDTCVTGDVGVNGSLTVNADFCTTGDLCWGQGGTIRVAQGETAMFGASACSLASCP